MCASHRKKILANFQQKTVLFSACIELTIDPTIKIWLVEPDEYSLKLDVVDFSLIEYYISMEPGLL